ncbi:MAG: multiprotein bridging factor aMBF1 [Candidatus Nanohaloarchaea archaeon]|nr:multiprotein bridging factor aMBF1 [Candidatus Nanohaloarchaea archaeon]
MGCEMCGSNAELKRTKVEGAVLKLCSDCQDAGKVMSTSTSRNSSGSRSKGSKRKPKRQREHLVPDFGEKVKKERESKGWSIERLADIMNEKESVVHRVESGKLKPDKKLAGKFKKYLDVKLYTRSGDVGYGQEEDTGSGGKATIGDVAEVRKRE